ncbi:unnamed protein product [Calypogeia fissa]
MSHGDEADYVLALAKEQFSEKDYAKAKIYALKAQEISPSLEGSQMLAVLETFTAAEKKKKSKVDTQMDWYGILQVNRADDYETIKKSYRKLAKLVHPDKNRGVGAEEAFRWLTDAWDILKDQEKKAAYDRTLPPMATSERNFSQNQSVACEMQSSSVGRGAGGSGQHFGAHRQDFRFERQPPSAAFDGFRATTGSTFRHRNPQDFSSRTNIQSACAASPRTRAATGSTFRHRNLQGFSMRSNRQSASAAFHQARATTGSTVRNPNLQDFSFHSNRQAGSAPFAGAAAATAFTNFQTNQHAKEETVGAEREKQNKRTAVDELQEEKNLKKARFDGATAATAFTNLQTNQHAKAEAVGAESEKQNKRKEMDEVQKEETDLKKARKAACEGEATVKLGEESETESGRQQGRNGAKGKSVADDINRAKRGVAENYSEEWHRSTNITETYGGGQRGAANRNPETPKRHNPENAVGRERKVADEFLARDRPITAASNGVSGSGGASAADDYMNKASRPSSKLHTDGISFEEQGVEGSGGEGLHGPPNVGDENNGDGGLGFTNLNSSSSAERPGTYRLAAVLSVAMPLLLASEFLRRTQILLPMQNESQRLVDWFFFF